MDYIFSATKFIDNQLFGKGANQIHSPFVFDFFNEVIAFPYQFYAFEEIENERLRLLQKKEQIEYQDLGASKKIVQRRISDLASSSLMPPNEAQLLFRLARWLKAKTIVELGVCLGITSSYLAKSNDGQLVGFEGISAIATEAKRVWSHLGIQNIVLVEGKIEETLPSYLNGLSHQLDLVILDANHRCEPTLKNFELLMPHLHKNSCLVFHDIYWSKEMNSAWEEIRKSPQVTISIDLFRMGLVFFRPESSKEHFKIRW